MQEPFVETLLKNLEELLELCDISGETQRTITDKLEERLNMDLDSYQDMISKFIDIWLNRYFVKDGEDYVRRVARVLF